MARPATVAPPAAPASLSADLVDGLRRLKLGTVRRLAPEILHTAKVQRWAPEEVLRTLIEAECASRDESNLVLFAGAQVLAPDEQVFDDC